MIRIRIKNYFNEHKETLNLFDFQEIIFSEGYYLTNHLETTKNLIKINKYEFFKYLKKIKNPIKLKETDFLKQNNNQDQFIFIALTLFRKFVKRNIKGNQRMDLQHQSIFSQYAHVNVNIGIGDLLEIKALNEKQNVLSFNKSALDGLKDGFDYQQFIYNLQSTLEQDVKPEDNITFKLTINKVEQNNQLELYIYVFKIVNDDYPIDPFAIINMTVTEDKTSLRLITHDHHDTMRDYCDSKLQDLYRRVTTFYQSGPELKQDTNLINVNTCNLPKQEFYPFLTKPIKEYINDFLNSNQTILILLGLPGTGKTTFIRQLMIESKSDSYQVFDPSAIENPELIIDFNKESGNILAIEDADAIIGRREDGNRLLGTYLNFADGITKKVEKKLIISTNLSDTNKIDPALIRPGRCYDILKFDKLTPDQANIVRASIGLQPKEFDKPIVLAEVLSDAKHSHQGNKVGFIN